MGAAGHEAFIPGKIHGKDDVRQNTHFDRE
jgi:hypothetical protein